jgi:ADP-ribosylglycohydrolase
MLGHAVGDALGVPVEFASREALAKDPVVGMRGFGTYPVPAGAWSDDTSMSIAALEAMCKRHWSCEDVMENFAAWLEKGKYTPTGCVFDVGGTCRRAIGRYTDAVWGNGLGRAILPPGFDVAEDCGLRDERSNGNGSLMRIHPFVLYATFHLLQGNGEGRRPWMECIQRGSSLTHAHDRSVMGCYIYGYCLRFLLKEATRESLMAGIRFAGEELSGLPELEHYQRIFAPDFANIPVNGIKSSGYVVDTLEAALWCVLNTSSYRDCVLRAVNLGGDTDTVAAVAGGLAGALYGCDAIPGEWLDTLLRRDEVEALCARAAKAWCARG